MIYDRVMKNSYLSDNIHDDNMDKEVSKMEDKQPMHKDKQPMHKDKQPMYQDKQEDHHDINVGVAPALNDLVKRTM